jgi:hypothetical protein
MSVVVRPRLGLWGALVALSAAAASAAAEKPLLTIQGGYLAYSSDHHFIQGEDVRVVWGEWTVRARSLKIDVGTRVLAVSGDVELVQGAERIRADEFVFDLEKASGTLLRFGARAVAEAFGKAPPAPEPEAALLGRRIVLDAVNWARLRSSLVYMTAQSIEIFKNFEVYGTGVILFLEGLPSLGIARFKLSGGRPTEPSGLSLDKIWYTGQQGLFADLRFSMAAEKKLQSLTQLHYEERSFLKNYGSWPRQWELRSSTTWTVSPTFDLGLTGNYSSTSLGDVRLFLKKQSQDGRAGILVDASYRKPLQSPGETWLGLQSTLGSEHWGTLSLQARYELRNQVLASLAYSKSFSSRMTLQLNSSYSHIRLLNGVSASKIFNGGLSLSYNADPIQAAAEYSLNDDLLGGRRLSRPQLRLALRPITFYGGLLTATLSNVLVSYTLHSGQGATDSTNNNTSFSLAAAPLWITSRLSLRANLSAEQFLEKEGRNFTTGGAVLRVRQEFGTDIDLEVLYNAQSRRRSRDWLIEGTTGQDLSARLRLGTPGRLTGWASVSYDPKRGEWKQGFADLNVGLIRQWRFQSLLSYDFYRRRLANIDVYLVRSAGSFDLRFVWRSLSKQFQIELVPALNLTGPGL